MSDAKEIMDFILSDEERRTAFVKAVARYDRDIAHPEIYEDLKDE